MYISIHDTPTDMHTIVNYISTGHVSAVHPVQRNTGRRENEQYPYGKSFHTADHVDQL